MAFVLGGNPVKDTTTSTPKPIQSRYSVADVKKNIYNIDSSKDNEVEDKKVVIHPQIENNKDMVMKNTERRIALPDNKKPQVKEDIEIKDLDIMNLPLENILEVATQQELLALKEKYLYGVELINSKLMIIEAESRMRIGMPLK